MKATARFLAAAGVLALLATTPPAGAATPMLLPDLRQAPVGCSGGWRGNPVDCKDWDVCMVTDVNAPNAPCVTTGDIKAVRLRFTSSEENVGDGPLLFYAHRDSALFPKMSVRQAFQNGEHGSIPDSYAAAQRSSGTSAYYEPAPAHMHWHLLNFERFQLRTLGGNAVVSDRKNGFCLGDRYGVADAVTLEHRVHEDDQPEAKLHQFLIYNMCEHQHPEATDVTEGISVGSGDDYRYDVDFQWLDITSVASGVYDVVNTVNPDRTLTESNYDNDSSSIAVSIQWPGKAAGTPSRITAPPVVRLLRSCPGTATCSA
ncbi:lysyl oxidase family protein [Kutzneria buriramensis]|uniref:Lysyl oxidase n=1 Tax=Kutzneria buriramensis TaxID=1045776 RepID=A0A3E0HBW3_9PSEU|nr:lysyl oxidase family protein [Kutzneria buriramensis]REH41797.1 lysyl oxidase [Kutzneria buriramensis]